MWFFRSPEIVFGEGALSKLEQLEGRCALIVTDANMVKFGVAGWVAEHLRHAGINCHVIFDEVEPNPSIQTVKRGAQLALKEKPDWVIGLGGGSAMDAAKAIYVMYERPDIEPEYIAPMESLNLRQKARLIAIPTTSGTGAETTWPIVLSDPEAEIKFSVGHPENIPDIAIVDPLLTMALPPGITADTGMDVIVHSVEGYTSLWHNDFADGMCLHALRLVFECLPRAYEMGAQDSDARIKMHNAATIAGLGFGNSMAATAHAMGHSLGAVFPVPHGRAVGLFLPYTIEFAMCGDVPTRYADIARVLGLPAADESEGAASLVQAIRSLARRIGQPLTMQEAGISQDEFEASLEKLVENAVNDSVLVVSPRPPTDEEVEQLYRCSYYGKSVDF
jgi:alcohol dehydrogenase class IV